MGDGVVVGMVELGLPIEDDGGSEGTGLQSEDVECEMSLLGLLLLEEMTEPLVSSHLLFLLPNLQACQCSPHHCASGFNSSAE